MTTRHIFATSIAALVLATAPAIYAAPASINMPVHAAFGKAKTVSVNFHNSSATPIELKVGEDVKTVAPGQTLNLHLPTGTRVIANTATPMIQAGTVITEVASYLDGATLNIK